MEQPREGAPTPAHLVQALLQAYQTLPKRGKPQPHEHTILAGAPFLQHSL